MAIALNDCEYRVYLLKNTQVRQAIKKANPKATTQKAGKTLFRFSYVLQNFRTGRMRGMECLAKIMNQSLQIKDAA